MWARSACTTRLPRGSGKRFRWRASRRRCTKADRRGTARGCAASVSAWFPFRLASVWLLGCILLTARRMLRSTGAVFHRERGWDHARRGGLAAHRALRAELGRPAAAAAAAAVTTTRTAAWAARAGACLPSRLDQARGGFLAQPPALGPCERDSLSLRAAVPRHAGVPGLRCLRKAGALRLL